MNLFECPEEACICSFIKYGNLLRHLAIGNHRRVPEKTTLLDTAKKLYHSKLMAGDSKTVISLSFQHALFNSSDFEEVPQLDMGWGLPVMRPPVRFSIKQKEFLDVSSFCFRLRSFSRYFHALFQNNKSLLTHLI